MSAAPVFMATSELGEWIERKMAERGINQSQLASFLKPRTSPSVVNAWLNRGSVPSPGMCVALAAFFHVRPEEVMRLAGHLPGEPDRVGIRKPPLWRFSSSATLVFTTTRVAYYSSGPA